MLYPLLKKLKFQPTQEALASLSQAEALFRWELFDSAEALALGTEIEAAAKAHGGSLAVEIQRLSDSRTLYQKIGAGTSERNLDYARKKANAAIRSNHCSLWPLIEAALTDKDTYDFEHQDDCLPVGGAFLIIEKDRPTAVVMASGLPDGLDHLALIEGRCAVLGCEVPVYCGPLI